jgi:PII-like signaling protein
MLKPGPAKRLIITVNESDRWHGRNTYNAILELLHHRGMAGATVSRAIAGFTGRGAIHTINLLELSADLPVCIEVVDTAEAVERVLPDIYDMVERGLVEVQDTQIIRFAGPAAQADAPAPTEAVMRLIGRSKMLQIHIGGNDKWEGEPLYEAIVKRARQHDIAGATVYRGVMGYGAHKLLHKHKTMALSSDDPIMISVIDAEEKINLLLASLESVISGGCMIAISDITVVRYEQHPASEIPLVKPPST